MICRWLGWFESFFGPVKIKVTGHSSCVGPTKRSLRPLAHKEMVDARHQGSLGLLRLAMHSSYRVPRLQLAEAASCPGRAPLGHCVARLRRAKQVVAHWGRRMPRLLCAQNVAHWGPVYPRHCMHLAGARDEIREKREFNLGAHISHTSGIFIWST